MTKTERVKECYSGDGKNVNKETIIIQNEKSTKFVEKRNRNQSYYPYMIRNHIEINLNKTNPRNLQSVDTQISI